MTGQASQVSRSEIAGLLRYFKRLRRLSRRPSPVKNRRLWAKAKEEATSEFLEEIKRRSRGITIPPSGRVPVQREATPEVQAHFEKMMDRNITLKAEEKYLAMDPRYRRKVEEHQRRVESLIKQIDHHVTALQYDLSRYSQVQKTLLVADWQELRQRLSPSKIMKFDEVDAFDRVIVALRLIKRRLRIKQAYKFLDKIGAAFCRVYEITLGKILDKCG